MLRSRFLQLGLGVTAPLMAGIPPVMAAAVTRDPLERWLARHGGTAAGEIGELFFTARPRLADLATSLGELIRLADGAIHCSGNQVSGHFGGRSFRIDLQPPGLVAP